MPAKKGTKSNGNNGFGGYTFINYTLSSDDKKKLAVLAASDAFPLALIGDLVAEGYKFSLSYDAQNGSFVATLTDTREDSLFHKHMLSGRGSIAINAFNSLCYKHLAIADGDWATIADPKASGGGDFG
jgi:hypothetical protein